MTPRPAAFMRGTISCAARQIAFVLTATMRSKPFSGRPAAFEAGRSIGKFPAANDAKCMELHSLQAARRLASVAPIETGPPAAPRRQHP